MDEYVKKTDVIDTLERTKCYMSVFGKDGLVCHPYEHYNEGLEDGMKKVRQLPSVNVKPIIKAKWKPCKSSISPYGNDVKCTNCGHKLGSSFGYKYCPICGAEMEDSND